MTDKKRVSYAESIPLLGEKVGERIGALAQARGLDITLASCTGDGPYGPQETESYGFLLETPESTRSAMRPAFVKYLTGAYLRPLIGTLWMNNATRSATPKRWVLDVYGRQYVEPLRHIAEELAEIFSVEIHVRLKSGRAQVERKEDNGIWEQAPTF